MEGSIRAPIRTIRIGAHPLHASLRLSAERALTSRSQKGTVLAMKRWDISQPVLRDQIDSGAPIFVSPAAMLAICLMVFGVLHAVASASAERLAIDGLLVINTSLYVAAALLAHAALRARASWRGFRLARYANNFSIAGLIMTIVGTCCLMLVIAIKA